MTGTERGAASAWRELYLKEDWWAIWLGLGIVLLGATLPFTLIVWAGPVAIAQATVVSLVTFFWIGIWAFTAGVGVNVVIGFVLSVIVFGAYWASL